MNIRPTQGFLDGYIPFSGRDRDIALEPARVQKLRGLEIVDLGRYKPQGRIFTKKRAERSLAGN